MERERAPEVEVVLMAVSAPGEVSLSPGEQPCAFPSSGTAPGLLGGFPPSQSPCLGRGGGDLAHPLLLG